MWRSAAGGWNSQVLRLTFAKMIFEFQYFYMLHEEDEATLPGSGPGQAHSDSHEPRICSMANSDKAQRISWVVDAAGGCSQSGELPRLLHSNEPQRIALI